MGFGTLVTNIIMFIAIITLTTTFIGVFKMYADESTSSMQIQSKVISNNLKTDITIQSTDFDNETDTITTNILNSGKTKLDIDYVDVYVDGGFVPRNTSNRTIEVIPSTEIEDPGIWNPKEILEIKIFRNVSKGSHTLKLATEYGVTDTDTFSE